MEIDLRTLARFHEMARRGAEEAADRLTDFTGVETELGVTKIKFVTTAEIQKEFDVDTTHVSVTTDLAGGPGGHSVVVFDEPSARELTDAIFSVMQPEQIGREESGGDGKNVDIDLKTSRTKEVTPELRESALTELSNMLGCAFVDGWADVLNTEIDVSAPVLRAGTNSRQVFGDLDRVGKDTEIALMFESDINVVDTEITFSHFLFPSIDKLEDTISKQRHDITGFDFNKLIGFDAMVEEGAKEAAKSMGKLTGCDTSVEIRHLNFVRVDQLTRDLADEPRIGVAFEYDGLPSGYLLFLFTEESAAELVRELVPNPPDDPFDEIGRSALQELGNIMASGVIDGWANVLNTGVDHTPPEYTHDIASAIADSLIAEVGQKQEYAFAFDTTLRADDKEFDCSIYSVCEHGDLEKALSRLDMDHLHRAHSTPSFPLEGVEKDPDSIESVDTEI